MKNDQRAGCVHKWSKMLSCSLGKHDFKKVCPQTFVAPYGGEFQCRLESWHFGLLNICRLNAGYYRMSVTVKESRRLCHSYIILMQNSGISIIQQNGRTFSLNPGQWTIIDLSIGFRISSNSTVEQVFLSHEGISFICQESRLTDMPVAVFEQNCIFLLFRKFISEIVSGTAGLKKGAADSVAEIACYFFRHAVMFQTPGIADNLSAGSIELSYIFRYIECHLEDPLLNADKIALTLGCSTRTIYRKFNGAVQESLEQYIWRRRLERAAFCLRSNPKGLSTISTIAIECGFTSLSHFCRLFKKQFNITPSRYRAIRA